MSEQEIDQSLDKLRELGVTTLRLGVPWTYVEPVNDAYDWAALDMIIDAADARNMDLTLTVVGTPA